MVNCRRAITGPANSLGLIQRIILHAAKRQWAVDRNDAECGTAAIKHREARACTDAPGEPPQLTPKRFCIESVLYWIHFSCQYAKSN